MISVPRGTYASMHAALLQKVVTEEGSIRRAARVLEVPRSTLGAWLRDAVEAEDDHDATADDSELVREPTVNALAKCSPSSGPLDPR
jgi:hypothetical protein